MTIDAARRRVLLQHHDGGGPVAIDVIAEGRGPALVMLPSSLRDSEDFDGVAAALAAAGHRVLRPQPRGMGGSRGALEGASLHTLAGDVAAVIRQLGGGRALIVGHAFGHYVARVAALDHAPLVRGVVVAAGAARSVPPGLAEALRIAADPAQPEAERLRQLRLAFFAPGHDPRPWLAGWHPTLREAYRAAGLLPPKDAWWPTSTVPVLDLQAADDPWRPAATRDELRAALGERATVRVIADASHALLPEQPAAVVAAVVAWAAGLPP